MRSNVPEKLLSIVEEIDANRHASLTRLTVMKKWFKQPSRLPAFGLWVARRRCQFSLLPWKYLQLVALVMLVLHGSLSRADDLAVETVRLPSLRIDHQPAKAHTQGLKLVDGKYYVTARRDDVRPKRALLLRSDP